MTSTLLGTPAGSAIELLFDAPARVRDAIHAIGRTEDVRFSPAGTRLAVVGFASERLLILDVSVSAGREQPRVVLTGGLELVSSALKGPHGVEFVGDRTLLVSNRGGDVTIFALPDGRSDVPRCELQPSQTWPGGGAALLDGPGSVAVSRLDDRVAEVLICNNHAHTVTRHLVAAAGTSAATVLLRKWLDIPDGIAVSRDGRWMAVSNHTTHDVLLYERGPALTADSDPDGILRGVHYPHGVRFSADARFLFVADAGAPYIQIFASDAGSWRGVGHPAASIRVMSDATFRQGAQSHDEGGPKGIDLDPAMRVLVATSKCQPLAFFDVAALVAEAARTDAEHRRRQQAAHVAYELHYLAEHRVTKAKAVEADYMKLSRAWQLTAPLRRLHAWIKERTT